MGPVISRRSALFLPLACIPGLAAAQPYSMTDSFDYSAMDDAFKRIIVAQESSWYYGEVRGVNIRNQSKNITISMTCWIAYGVIVATATSAIQGPIRMDPGANIIVNFPPLELTEKEKGTGRLKMRWTRVQG